MRLKSFNERENTKLHEDVAMVEIIGKRNRILTPSLVNALSLLISKRSECDVCAFLFARPKSMSYYRGQDCLHVHANQCGANYPEHLRSTQLRKHVATFSQVLNLKNKTKTGCRFPGSRRPCSSRFPQITGSHNTAGKDFQITFISGERTSFQNAGKITG